MGEREVSQGIRVVMGLVKCYFGTWNGVTVDSLFTTAILVEEMFSKTGNICIS
jgi:hypothetical protein